MWVPTFWMTVLHSSSSLKRWHPPVSPQGVTTRMTTVDIFTALRTSDSIGLCRCFLWGRNRQSFQISFRRTSCFGELTRFLPSHSVGDPSFSGILIGFRWEVWDLASVSTATIDKNFPSAFVLLLSALKHLNYKRFTQMWYYSFTRRGSSLSEHFKLVVGKPFELSKEVIVLFFSVSQ